MSKTTSLALLALGAGSGAAVTAAALHAFRSDSKPYTSLNPPRPRRRPSPPHNPRRHPRDPNLRAPVHRRRASSPSARLPPPSTQPASSTHHPGLLAIRDGDRRGSTFLEDDSIPTKFRALLKDYFRSGYDRGHQMPAADAKWSQKAMDETFYLSNMCPQVGEGFNRDYWAHFEDFCRRLTGRYPPSASVAVPTHFYKVIFAEDGRAGGNVAIGAFVMPNAPIPNSKPLTDFEVPLEAIERASGLEFAEKLPLQRRRRLCAEGDCAIIVREFADKKKALPAPKR
ncbi:unnamed protein product [Parascedosporium putredinis]|uniref:Endonuclease n=1 Tax=Parascedosporium putredinis TaxID=1442378 RepID=A0A9P1H9V1_9PEZI|nr:unnamed protein product [Parascedosporium putredinis]CAI8000789.1 unnamed protein product [Parascedosporium putredinis]